MTHPEKREWKPCDVAIVTASVADQPMTGTAVRWRHGWLIADTAGCHALVHDREVTNVRPRAVIDPEDREQVRRIEADMARRCGWALLSGEQRVDALIGVLRSLITPPKPDEPTGLGAVVEATCRCGGSRRFVYEPLSDRFEGQFQAATREAPWKSQCGHHVYADLTAVRILSEGVTQ